MSRFTTVLVFVAMFVISVFAADFYVSLKDRPSLGGALALRGTSARP